MIKRPDLEEALLVSPPALLPGERPLGFRRLPEPEGAEEDEELLEELEVDAIGGGDGDRNHRVP